MNKFARRQLACIHDFCEANKAGDLATIERTEFRQFGDQGAGDGFSNTWYGASGFSFSTQTADPRV